MKRLQLLLVAVALIVGNFAAIMPAQAATIPPGPCPPGPTYYQRCFWHGYYSNKLYDYGGAASATRAMIACGLPTSLIRGQSDFIYYVTKWLNGDDATACPSDPTDVNTTARIETTASFYINTMLGYQGTSFDSSGQVGGVYNARKHLADWTALVRRLDAAGEIQWNSIANVPSGTGHSFWTGDSTVNGGVGGFLDAAFYETQALVGEPLITFTYPNGTKYSIRRICGNVMSNGVDASIDYELTPTIGFKSTTGIIGTGNTIKAGDTLTFDAGMQNNSKGDPADTEVGAPNPNPTYVIPKGQTVVSDGLLEEQYYGDPNKSGYLPWPATPAPANPSYVWARSSSPPKADTDWNPRYTFSYQISPNTPDGTPVCFNTYVDPAKGIAGRTPTTALANSNKLCYTVTNPAFPLIIGQQGDVHAGGGVNGSTCTTAGGLSGSVIGNQGSLGEYVVSANGGVSNFGSANTLSNKATLGSYYAICRPDLYGSATAYKNAGRPLSNIGGTINLSSLNDPSGVYYVAGNATINGGTLTKKATIIVTGTVTINGNILLGGSATGSQQPSLGIIANGDIRITGTGKGVNQTVDAFLFANGGIDTCFQYVSRNYAPCQNVLTVNGFLMGKVLAFHRLGTPVTTGGAVNAETINLLPQLYLNPPTLFDDAANKNLLQNEGERLPLN